MFEFDANTDRQQTYYLMVMMMMRRRMMVVMIMMVMVVMMMKVMNFMYKTAISQCSSLFLINKYKRIN